MNYKQASRYRPLNTAVKQPTYYKEHRCFDSRATQQPVTPATKSSWVEWAKKALGAWLQIDWGWDRKMLRQTGQTPLSLPFAIVEAFAVNQLELWLYTMTSLGTTTRSIHVGIMDKPQSVNEELIGSIQRRLFAAIAWTFQQEQLHWEQHRKTGIVPCPIPGNDLVFKVKGVSLSSDSCTM